MTPSVDIIVAISQEAAETLRDSGCLTEYASFDTIPQTFKDVIREFMADNVGFETGPIFCLTRINGDSASLKGAAFGGDVQVTDILPVQAGDALLELHVPVDTMVSIGMEKLFLLASHASEYGDDDELVLNTLKDSLVVGATIEGEDNVFSFLSKIQKEDCSKFLIIDEKWNARYSSLFRGMEEVSISELAKF